MKELKDFPISQFQDALLSWFERNMRDLPWRKDRDPYKIWVSEIMLQQTQVDTVIPYFNRFMERFPSLEALAEAPEDDVLKHWEGLGYYSRARNLQTAVKEVQEQYGGKVPDEPNEIAKLKGVGPYTAGAILSIAYGKPEPAVDGNVMRVFSRIFAIQEDIQKPKTRKLFEELIRGLIPENSTSYFNQGIMELGALICRPKSPQCMFCPVIEMCQGRSLGIEQELPVKQKKKKPKLKKMVAGVVLANNMVFIRQRPETGLLAKLYEFPNLEWEADAELEISKYLYQTYDFQTETSARYEHVQHTFSHLIWDITVLELNLVGEVELVEGQLPVRLERQPFLTNAEAGFWVTLEELDRYAFPVSHQKIKKQLLEK
ncbi:A/G-specific adenine glycosylase [Bacillus horti]|uniref:Adenine DNA glycosylase n=1 Tax=Caldalkalibacillus horti TaxID=77523 RepID=A0ABT9W1D6_9BACI|nr:A/G-specific adenine glycosylase [Bacillus horti]MDQ0167064.1 A/G-specific adenine glycosylase [Bacillus horti]